MYAIRGTEEPCAETAGAKLHKATTKAVTALIRRDLLISSSSCLPMGAPCVPIKRICHANPAKKDLLGWEPFKDGDGPDHSGKRYVLAPTVAGRLGGRVRPVDPSGLSRPAP